MGKSKAYEYLQDHSAESIIVDEAIRGVLPETCGVLAEGDTEPCPKRAKQVPEDRHTKRTRKEVQDDRKKGEAFKAWLVVVDGRVCFRLIISLAPPSIFSSLLVLVLLLLLLCAGGSHHLLEGDQVHRHVTPGQGRAHPPQSRG